MLWLIALLIYTTLTSGKCKVANQVLVAIGIVSDVVALTGYRCKSMKTLAYVYIVHLLSVIGHTVITIC